MTDPSAAFDPYHKWLGIPPRDQPPNHYRLLGIKLFETDAEVITAAAGRLIDFCKTNATGPHAADARRVAQEVAAARKCLVDPTARTTYDAALQAKLATARPVAAPPVSPVVMRNPAVRTVVKVDRGATSRPPVAPPRPTVPVTVAQPVPIVAASVPVPPGPAGFDSELFDVIGSAPVAGRKPGNGSKSGSHKAVDSRAAHATHAHGDEKKSGRKKNNSLLMVGGLAAATLLLLITGAVVLSRSGKQEVAEEQSSQTKSQASADDDLRAAADRKLADNTNSESKPIESEKSPSSQEAPEDDTLVIASAEEPASAAADPNVKSAKALSKSTDSELLRIASNGGSAAKIKKLIAAGAELEMPDEAGRTPLRRAVINGQLATIKALLDAKAKVNAQDSLWTTPLMSAAQLGDVKLIKLLIEAGADPNQVAKSSKSGTKSSGITPLHVAARFGNTDVALLLIERGARIDAPNDAKVTPLMVAAWQGHAATALALIEKGAEFKSITDAAGQTPLMYAASGGKLEIVSAMLARGALVGPTSKTGANALAFALGAPKPNPLVVEKLRTALGDEAPTLDF